jgi:hypothetical protein
MLSEVCGGARRSRGAAKADGSAAAKADGGATAPAKSRRGSLMMVVANGGPTPACMEGMRGTGRDDASFFGDTRDRILR